MTTTLTYPQAAAQSVVNARPAKSPHPLTAQWSVVDGRLICKWTSAQ